MYTPASNIIGSHKYSGEPAPDIINLTLSTLDPRLTYTGPAHYYFNSAGVLTLSAANEWPLEYRNGVPMGRHEPEPAAVNQFNSTGYLSNGVTSTATTGKSGLPGILLTEVTGTRRHNISPAHTYTVGQSFTLSAFVEQTAKSRGFAYVQTSSNSIAAVSILGGISFSDASISWSSDNSVTGVTLDAELISQGVISMRSSLTPTVETTATNAAEIGSSIASLNGVLGPTSYAGDTTYSLVVSGLQFEDGILRTSPIVATDGTASRAASSVTLDTTGVSYIVVGYSDGSSNNYDTPDDTFTIPLASRNWGDRYIAAIEVISS
ncbi:hypothetical protein ACN0IV_12800 [Trabulsiella odontotermitis]